MGLEEVGRSRSIRRQEDWVLDDASYRLCSRPGQVFQEVGRRIREGPGSLLQGVSLHLYLYV